ncbi:unnamed protein product [Lupinus luteus]|uniref:Uncharacterized protein n=1 Tax=Lupinus luteus TaxID=3873 RepID=A0AAV1XAR5_LUPLU
MGTIMYSETGGNPVRAENIHRYVALTLPTAMFFIHKNRTRVLAYGESNMYHFNQQIELNPFKHNLQRPKPHKPTAKFKMQAVAIMGLFFALTTPIGIGIGIGITNVYDENSPTALIVEGVFNAASAGILIYMALVDLLAADFMHPRMQQNGRLQLGANASLLLGAGCMSLLAKWA